MDFKAIEAKLAEVWAQIEPFLKKLYDFIMGIK